MAIKCCKKYQKVIRVISIAKVLAQKCTPPISIVQKPELKTVCMSDT